MKTLENLLAECRETVAELFPWDLEELLAAGEDLLIVDVREPEEYARMHIPDSINVPRGILETSIEWGFDETIPELVEARQRKIVVACRSGNRSLFAARRMMEMGYENVLSLKTGLRGWSEYDQPLMDPKGSEVEVEDAEDFFTSRVSNAQLPPERRD